MISLTLPLPPSINQTSRAGVNRKTGQVYKPGARLKNQYNEWVRLYCVANGLANAGMRGTLGIAVQWYFERDNKDIDGGIKTLADAIAKAVGFNDKQIKQAYLCVEDREKGVKPHCVVRLVELEYEELPER